MDEDRMPLPDPIERGETACDDWFCDTRVGDQNRCGCGRLFNLEEGETAVLSVAMFGAGLATTWAVEARWAGWVYPLEVEGEAGTIRATVQDPGVGAPLGNPFPRDRGGSRRRRS